MGGREHLLLQESLSGSMCNSQTLKPDWPRFKPGSAADRPCDIQQLTGISVSREVGAAEPTHGLDLGIRLLDLVHMAQSKDPSCLVCTVLRPP